MVRQVAALPYPNGDQVSLPGLCYPATHFLCDVSLPGLCCPATHILCLPGLCYPATHFLCDEKCARVWRYQAQALITQAGEAGIMMGRLPYNLRISYPMSGTDLPGRHVQY
eukprot:1509537-Rhodomonas_salina.4